MSAPAAHRFSISIHGKNCGAEYVTDHEVIICLTVNEKLK